MRRIPLAALALPLILAACEMTPRQECQSPFNNQLYTVRAEIRVTSEALSKGYRLVPMEPLRIGIRGCYDEDGHFQMCEAGQTWVGYQRQRIVRAAEQAKLDALMSEKARLEREIASCAAQFPE